MKVVVLHSGGLDSTVLLYHHVDTGDEVECLGFYYGQRHKRELANARDIQHLLGVHGLTVDLPTRLFQGSALTPVRGEGGVPLASKSVAVPEGHYAEESMKATIVPNRNSVLLSMAVAYAVSLGYDAVSYAAHSGDHAIYPDCRPEFFRAFDFAEGLATGGQVATLAPFIHKSKADIVKLGWELTVPFDRTWSCYNGRGLQCGKCGTCYERKEAFELAGVPDPTHYEAAQAEANQNESVASEPSDQGAV